MGKKMILAVDDAQANLQVIQAALGGDYELRLAKSGNMALLILDRVKPDLILLDIEMPGMSGLDFMAALRGKEALRDIPVIFVTAHADKDLVEDAAKRGARGYVVKPFEPGALRDKVRQALEGEGGGYG
jgi:putative two-component system response regulator